MENKSVLEANSTPVSLLQISKRVEENENELQESAKKQKRDEVAEEQRKKDEIVSYYSFLDPETDMPEMLSTLKEQYAGSKTIYAKNLSYSVEQADLEDLFKECGQIVDIRLHLDSEGRFRGFGHIEFATAEAAQNALKLNHTELLRCRMKIGIAPQKPKYASNRSFSNSFQKCERDLSPTIYVRGFDSSLPVEKIKATLEEHFGSCGEIVRISVPKFRESGDVRGFAHLEFNHFDSVYKALDLDQSELGGCDLTVEKAKPRRENQGIGGGGRHEFGGSDGSVSNKSHT